MQLRLKSILDETLSINLKYLTYFFSILASTRGPLYRYAKYRVRSRKPSRRYYNSSDTKQAKKKRFIDLYINTHFYANIKVIDWDTLIPVMNRLIKISKSASKSSHFLLAQNLSKLTN